MSMCCGTDELNASIEIGSRFSPMPVESVKCRLLIDRVPSAVSGVSPVKCGVDLCRQTVSRIAVPQIQIVGIHVPDRRGEIEFGGLGCRYAAVGLQVHTRIVD